MLISKGDMLKEYFSLEINKLGMLCTIPELIESYIPCVEDLPLFVLFLATRVEWEEEQEYCGCAK